MVTGVKLQQIQNVSIREPEDGQVLTFDGGDGQWKAVTPADPVIPDPPPDHTTYEVRLAADDAMSATKSTVTGMSITVADAGVYLLHVIGAITIITENLSSWLTLYITRSGSVTSSLEYGRVDPQRVGTYYLPYTSVVTCAAGDVIELQSFASVAPTSTKVKASATSMSLIRLS